MLEQTYAQNRKFRLLTKELQSYERSGTHLYIDGHPGKAQEIAAACTLREDTDYMRDFISEDGSHISEIHFVKIQKRTN